MTELTSVQNPTIKRIKALKDKKARETQREMLVEGEKLMLEAAREYEMEAERFVGYTSAEKLNYVLSRLRTLAAELGCPFREEEMVAQIEADIAYSKGVNARESDKLE